MPHLWLFSHTLLGLVFMPIWVAELAMTPKEITSLSNPLTFSLAQLVWVVFQMSGLLCLHTAKAQSPLWNLSMIATEMAHLLVFFTHSLLVFFTAYETVLIPLMVIISRNGSGAGRLRATLLFFIYTLAGSVSMLLAVLFLTSSTGEMIDGGSEALVSISLTQPLVSGLWLAFGVAFAVKTPLYPFLIWLIHAHAEAPLEGSVILAGVVLKLAIFGISAILLGTLWEGGLVTLSYSLSLSLATLLLASGTMLQQVDLKGFVALSSVAHMGLGTLGILTLTEDGSVGAWLMSIAHGLISPCLFLLTGGFLYRSFGTRLMYPYRGLSLTVPFMSFTFLLASLANMATPLSPNWESELMVMLGLIWDHKFLCALSSLSVVLGALYSIWLYVRLALGEWSPLLRVTLDASPQETVTLLWVLAVALLLGCLTTGMTETLADPVWNALLS